MAEDDDDSQKTEDPSGKKLEDAAKHGDVIQSQELKHLIVLSAATLVMVTMSGSMATRVTMQTVGYLEQPDKIPFDGGHLMILLRDIVLNMIGLLGLPVLFLMIASIAASAIQNPLSLEWERFSLNFGRLSPLTGFSRLVGIEPLREMGKGTVKLIIVGGAGLLVLWQNWMEVPGFINLDVALMLPKLMALTLKMLMAMLIVQTALSGGDYFINRARFLARNRMTKQEVKDEYKQSEGDPMIKGRIRSLRMQRARQRMMQSVPQATVVVTNPTHYAVALKYDEDSMAAPVCVAKGVDLIAAKIREIAEANGVPMVANPPLARALHASVEIDDPVPPQHFKAVAEVIGFVWRLKGRTAKRPEQTS